MRIRRPFLSLFLASTAFSQMSAVGDFHYILSHRVAEVGQTVVFEAREFDIQQCDYDVTYELLPTPISSKRTFDVNMIAKRRPECRTLSGYSGPKVVFDSLSWGVYRLQFDSSSDFRKDLGDTNSFEILYPSANIPGTRHGSLNRDPGGAALNGTLLRWREKDRRVDGRLEIRLPRTP
jgi:hypothetical protein